MDEKQIYNLFKEKGALLEGHFLLSSGLHSPMYMQCAKLLQYPDIAEKLCSQLAGNFKDNIDPNTKSFGGGGDVVIAPAVGGIIVGHEVARALKIRAIFAERVEDKMALRRGFELKKGENILAVEDVITTGGSLKEIIQLAKEKGCNIIGAGSLVDRSGGKVQFDIKKVALLSLGIKTYSKESCPLCKQGIPVTYLGSRPACQSKAAGRHKSTK
jgi:orotate phosphoribosyltransferase